MRLSDNIADTTGIRDLEQAAEHIAANALYQIEVNHVASVTFDAACGGSFAGVRPQTGTWTDSAASQ